MKVYKVNEKAPVGRIQDKYYGHEKYWGNLVVFSDSTWYNYAVLFSPCGRKRNHLNKTSFDMLSESCEVIEESISNAEKRHFERMIEKANYNDLYWLFSKLVDRVNRRS